MNDANGTARATVSQSYDFVLANIGIDKDSGKLWQEYIQFIRGAPGQIGGSSWQDQQKMDQLRKAYQRAVNVPMSALNGLWKEYDHCELSESQFTLALLMSQRVVNFCKRSHLPTCLREVQTQLWNPSPVDL